jgi:hypothetical protein
MAQIIIDIGAAPDDGLGTPLRSAFADINQMFTEVYQSGPVSSNVRIANNTISTTVINSNLVLSPSGIGKIQVNNAVVPAIGDVYDLGSPSQRFNTMYVGTGGFDILGDIVAGGLDIGGNITAAGNIAGNFFIGDGSLLTNITAGDRIINGTTELVAYQNSNIAFTINGAANLVTLSGNQFNIDVDTFINGNLIVDGNVKSINVENLNIKDPIIGLGRGANNTPLTSNDGLDRGTQLWYFTTAEKSAFFGYNNSTGNLLAASDVTVSNEIVSVNNYGTINTGNVIADGNITAEYLFGNATTLTGVMADRGNEPSANWNNITNMGIYTVNRTSWSGTQNTPIDSGVFVGMLEVKNSTGLAITQTFWPGTVDIADVKLMWVRNYWDGTWTDWQKMINGSQTIDGGDQF